MLINVNVRLCFNDSMLGYSYILSGSFLNNINASPRKEGDVEVNQFRTGGYP